MDTRTLLLLNLLLLASFAVGLLVVCFASPALRQLRWLVPAYASGSLATLLLLSWARLPAWLGTTAIDVLVLLAYVLLHRALCDLTGASRRLGWIGLWLLPLQAVGTGWLVLHHYPVSHLIALVSLMLTFQLALSGVTVLRHLRPGLAAPAALMAAILFLYSLFNLFRLLVILAAQPGQAAGFTSVLYLRNGNLALTLFTSVGILFSFIWMNTETLRLELERMARTDALTGLLNRRALLDEFERESARSARDGSELCMLLMDLDHFKQVNDRCGHSAGDAALCSVAQVLRTSLRRGDLVGRLGGEEFGALLPQTTEPQAVMLAERLRERIAQLQIPGDASAPEDGLRITASFGVAAWGGDAESLEQLMNNADVAMYLAKRAGRNCVRARAAERRAAAPVFLRMP
jgi:diguanylate cyclase (GGDEF)-like protein